MKRLLLYGSLALSLAANVTVLGFTLRSRAMASNGLSMMVKVRLDEAQREKVSVLRERFLEDRGQNLTQAAEQRSRLAELLKSDSPDRDQIEAVLARLTELQIALQRRIVHQAISVRAVLRPAQLPAFDELMTERLRSGTPMHASDSNPQGQ